MEPNPKPFTMLFFEVISRLPPCIIHTATFTNMLRITQAFWSLVGIGPFSTAAPTRPLCYDRKTSVDIQRF